MRIAVIGAGYVGLTSAACIAELGHQVVCVDVDAPRILALQQGGIPIHEVGLAELVITNLSSGRLCFSINVEAAAAIADIVLIAVGTPKGKDGDVDLSHVEAAARQIAAAIKPKTVVAIKSTVAVGTARLIREAIAERRGGLDFLISSNPEFLREGSAVKDFLEPDRIVIGADDPDAAAKLSELYGPLLARDVPLVVTSTVNAELIKYAANAFLALKVAFINDVANLCESAEADICAVARGMGLDHRIGPQFLAPGPGYGGSCFPKDTAAFVAAGRMFAAPQPLIEATIARNEARKHHLADRILSELNGLDTPKVGVLGVAFKAGTDDVREAAALTIVPALQSAGVAISAYDPQAQINACRHLDRVSWQDNPYEACRDADLVVILTEWDCFRTVDLAKLSEVMRGRTIFDCRNLMDPQDVASHGLRYVSIGRCPVPRAPVKSALRNSRQLPWRETRASDT